MSWLYSRVLVEEYLAGTCSDGAPFAPSSGNPTPQAYLPSDKMTAFSRPSRFGMTFAPLTGDRGMELLTWYLADSRARTSAQPGKVPGFQGNEAECGQKWRGLLARYDRDLRLWKTPQCSLFEDSEPCLETWPRWGLMQDGECLEPVPSAPTTSAKESGLLPTPLASIGTNGGPNQRDSSGRPGLQMAAMTWPTPKANDAEKRGNFDVTNPRNGLPAAVKRWPTPTASDHTGPGHAAQGGMNLRTMVSLFPTPTASNTKAHHMRGADNGKEREARSYGATGQLNPTWVEWLMGWPLGWTDLKPLETDKYRNAQQRHGGF